MGLVERSAAAILGGRHEPWSYFGLCYSPGVNTCSHVIVAGAGHLSMQVFRRLHERNYDVRRVRLRDGVATDGDQSVYEELKARFVEVGMAEAEAVFIVDDDDQQNIRSFLIAS